MNLTRRELLKAATIGAVGLAVPLPSLRGIPVERAESVAVVPEFVVQKATAYITMTNELLYDDLPYIWSQYMQGVISATSEKTWTYTPA